MVDLNVASYKFKGRLKSHFPSQVIVDVTEVCNLECIHCPHPDFKRSSQYAKRFLDISLNRKLIEEVSKFGQGATQYIRYTSNGEPLVHPKIYDMLDDAVMNSGVFVTLTTNGTTMDERRIERLLASGLHMVDISIDAFLPETYSRIRKGGTLDATRQNVLHLIKIRNSLNSKTRIVVSFIEQPQNSNEISEFQDYWNSCGVDSVVIRRLHSAAGGVPLLASSMLKKQTLIDRKPCLYPWERITLNPKGFLAFCPQDWVHGSELLDYRKNTIRDVWSGEIYQKLRDAHLKNAYSEFQFCGNCPDWAQTRWPGEGDSYADLVEGFLND